MTAVIVQCRLASTRLPEKALLPLGTAERPLFFASAINSCGVKLPSEAVEWVCKSIITNIISKKVKIY